MHPGRCIHATKMVTSKVATSSGPWPPAILYTERIFPFRDDHVIMSLVNGTPDKVEYLLSSLSCPPIKSMSIPTIKVKKVSYFTFHNTLHTSFNPVCDMDSRSGRVRLRICYMNFRAASHLTDHATSCTLYCNIYIYFANSISCAYLSNEHVLLQPTNIFCPEMTDQ